MQDENNTNHPEPEYIYDEEIHKGLRELLADKTMLKMFSVTPEEIEWLKTVIIEGRKVTKKAYIETLLTYRNLEDKDKQE